MWLNQMETAISQQYNIVWLKTISFISTILYCGIPIISYIWLSKVYQNWFCMKMTMNKISHESIWAEKPRLDFILEYWETITKP